MHIATCDANGIRDGEPFEVKKGRPVPKSLEKPLERLGIAVKKQTRKKGTQND